jgi:hypothetical protein
MSTTTMHNVGITGTVNGYAVLIIGNQIIVSRDGEEIDRRTVDGIGSYAAAARDLRLGWGQFPDDAQVIFAYDKADECFGYAINLDWPDGSEWGYAPFPSAA